MCGIRLETMTVKNIKNDFTSTLQKQLGQNSCVCVENRQMKTRDDEGGISQKAAILKRNR